MGKTKEVSEKHKSKLEQAVKQNKFLKKNTQYHEGTNSPFVYV